VDGTLLQGDESYSDRFKLDLSVKGSLLQCVNKELLRAAEASKGWKYLLKELPNPIPFERRTGGVFFIVPDHSKEVYFDFDEYRLSPHLDECLFGNSLCIKTDEPNSRGSVLAERTLSAARRIFDNEIFQYGYACLSDQYDAKNLDRTGGGVCAVGLDASKCLPGFYWGNYFGPFLCDRIGEQVLMTAPGCRSYRLQSGVLVTNDLPPDAWSDPAFIKNENAAMDHIGRELFFEKGKPMTGKLFT
jgi:hypothetical protein